MRTLLAAAAALISLAPAALADTYAFTLTPSSSANWDLSVAAPFATSGDPRSTILGSYDATTNPTGTRTIPGLFGSDNGLNNAINISAGSATASGSSGSTPLHPAGAFALHLNPGDGAIEVSGLTLDLLQGQAVTIATNVSVTYASFRTRQPTCTLPGGFPVSVPLGDGSVTALTAVQESPLASGTLTPDGPASYTFTIPLTLTVTVTATLNGAPLAVDPQTVDVVFAGTIALSGNTATLSGSVDLSNQQSQPGPTALAPLAFDDPLCTSHLLANIVLSAVNVTLNSTASIVATGPRTCTDASIAQPPAPTTAPEGTAAQLTVAPGGSAPFTYQWRRNGTPVTNSPRISGATAPTLRFDPALPGDSGNYTCTVANACGSATTPSTLLTITPAPACDPDLNQDGNADQEDVRTLVDIIAGGPNPNNVDPDFNHDGNADQEDIRALVNVVAGGPCP